MSTYRFLVVGTVSTRQSNTLRQLGLATASDGDLVALGVELCKLALRVGPLQAENLVTEDVLSGSNAGRQLHGPGAVLEREPLAGPRRLGLIGVVASLVDLDPDIAGAAVELTAGTLAIGQIGHDCIELW